MDDNLNNNQPNLDSNNSNQSNNINQTFNNMPNQNQVTNGTNNMVNQGNMTNNLNSIDSQGMMNNNLNNMNSQNGINNNGYTNNITNQPLDSNMNSGNQKDNNNSKKNTKLYIIVGIVILLLVVGAFAFLNKKGGSNAGGTVNIGESLHIVQKSDGWDFNIKVLDFEKNHSAEVLLEKKQLPALNIEITNNSNTELLVDALSFRLLDSSNNTLSSTDLWAETSEKNAIKSEIKKGETASGYKIFSDTDSNSKEYDVNDVSKLEIRVPINMKSDGTKITYDYVEYYINLK